MTRWIASFVAIAAVAPASAQPSGRKASGGDALQMRAVEDFVEAVLADRAGDLDKAVREYENANRQSPHANTYYNIADLYRRMEKWSKAVESYKKYLELAPKAPDRAAVQKLIEQIEKLPAKAVIDGEDLDGVVFMDGKLLGPSPQIVTIPDKERHQIDRITPKGHSSRTIVVSPMRVAHERMTASREQPGNVVFSASPDLPNGNITIAKDLEVAVPGRTTLKPGRYKFPYYRPGFGCAPVEFEVPAGNAVTFVYFAGAKRKPGEQCTPITANATRVRFPP